MKNVGAGNKCSGKRSSPARPANSAGARSGAKPSWDVPTPGGELPAGAAMLAKVFATPRLGFTRAFALMMSSRSPRAPDGPAAPGFENTSGAPHGYNGDSVH